ncbi:hypothetical protein ACSQ67_005542 [Phaseolus vulgaris]
MFCRNSFSMEENTRGSDIVVVACQTKQDCLKNIRALPCGASVVKCSMVGEAMSKKSLVLAVVFVILAMEICVGWRRYVEEEFSIGSCVCNSCHGSLCWEFIFDGRKHRGSDIVVVACQTKQDCLKNIRALPCGASVVKCSMVGEDMSKKSLVLAVVFVILAMEVCNGHSFSMEENREEVT